jgi:hypothetical protein
MDSTASGLYITVDTAGSYALGAYFSANDAQTYWNDHSSAWDAWFEDWGIVSGSAPPTVVTNAVTNLTTTGATLNGNLSSLGSATSAVVSFEWGLTTSYGSLVAGTPANLSAPGAFTANLSGLTASTTYHYRAKADGGTAGVSYGTDQGFTTSSSGGSNTLYENYHASADSTGIGLHSAQTFTPQTAHTIKSVKLRLINTGATGSVTVSIRAVDLSGAPTGSNLVTSSAASNSGIPAAWTVVTFDLGAGYLLQAGT